MKKSAGKYSDIQGNSGSTPDYVLISVLVTALHIFKFYSIVYKKLSDTEIFFFSRVFLVKCT